MQWPTGTIETVWSISLLGRSRQSLSIGHCFLMIGVRKPPHDGMSVFAGRVN